MKTNDGGPARDPDYPHVEIWTILVETCGAQPVMPLEFVLHFPQCKEYRFQGALGFGGKVYDYGPARDGSSAYVGFYWEDSTTERRAMRDKANALLTARTRTTEGK